MFLPSPPRGHYGPNPRGCIKRASEYPRPDEVRGGELYRSERSERRSDRDSPKQPNPLRNDDGQIFVGWVGGTPECFFYFALALVPCLILFDLVWLSLSPCLFPVYLALLGRPCIRSLPFVVALLDSFALSQLVAFIA